jgi:hypothetical protein
MRPADKPTAGAVTNGVFTAANIGSYLLALSTLGTPRPVVLRTRSAAAARLKQGYGRSSSRRKPVGRCLGSAPFVLQQCAEPVGDLSRARVNVSTA